MTLALAYEGSEQEDSLALIIAENHDTLDMAANAPTTDENYQQGVVMTLDKAAKALEALHVEEIEALGKPFDPNFMNAVQRCL